MSIHVRVEEWIRAHQNEIIRDIMRLASIRSVATYDQPPTPYGEGCKRALDEMLKIGTEQGFHTRNYEDQVGCLYLEEKDPCIGLWGHLDVVPEGDNWDFPPYMPTYQDGLIIARGADDNKGPTIAALYTLRCLKELGIPLRYGLKLFVGCDEEHGMRDVEYFASHYECPALSIIPDCGFPVCYGEKGMMGVDIVSEKPLSRHILSLKAGQASNIVPDYAELVLAPREGLTPLLEGLPAYVQWEIRHDGVVLSATGEARHTAFPEGGVNAIHQLTSALVGTGLLPLEDEAILRFFTEVNSDFYGTALGIAMEDELSGRLTCVGSMASLRDGHGVLHLNIRYCITADAAQLIDTMRATCEANGCRLEVQRDSKPNYFPREHPAVHLLTEVYQRLTGDGKEPYVMGGGTYARKLPNALGFGLGGLPREESPLLRPGHGGAHGPDEALYLDNLFRAMGILAMGLIELDANLDLTKQ